MTVILRQLLVALIIFVPVSIHAQVVGEMDDESRLYAQSKQVNQFFRRFNGEEDEKGNRYYAGDKLYRNVKLRKKYLSVLFDETSTGMQPSLKGDFVKEVLDKDSKSILDFHSHGWFSEVHATFSMNGKPQRITLFMELEKSHKGYKWVIRHVRADMFATYFDRDTVKVGRFLHPMSHELDFMNLRKAFSRSDSISQYAARDFKPDHLSVFLYEVKKGNLKFVTVNEVQFHFFLVDGWYFELVEFNRPGYNTGWLISNLIKLKNDNDKKSLQQYLYR